MTDENIPEETRMRLYIYFGTFTRSMFTMFELTLSSFIPVSRLLIENVSEWYIVPMVVYKMVMGFAVVKVITGVFLHETFKVAAMDDDLMVLQKSRASAKFKAQMSKLFASADTDNNGTLSRTELQEILTETKTKTWLAAMDLEVDDADKLFDFINPNESEEISLKMLTDGIQRLRGPARSIDMVALMRKCLNL